MNTQSMTYIITAPSGTGKSTINRRLVKDIENLEFSVSYTTRDRRPDEINGIHYWFIEQKEFKKLIQQKEMLEWAEVFGNFYGTSQLEINRIISQRKEALLEIDVQGWLTLKKSVNPLCSLFILPPSISELWNRLSKRGTEPLDVAKKRLKKAQIELTIGKDFDHFIINDDFEKTYQSIKSFITEKKDLPITTQEGRNYCNKLLEEFQIFEP